MVRPKEEHRSHKDDPSAILTGFSLASGSLLGAGLAVLAQRLSHEWQSVAIPFIPTISAACSLTVRAIAIRAVRRFKRKLWEADRDLAIAETRRAILAMQKALLDLRNEEARKMLLSGIDRSEKRIALTVTAIPGERPWEREIESLLD